MSSTNFEHVNHMRTTRTAVSCQDCNIIGFEAYRRTGENAVRDRINSAKPDTVQPRISPEDGAADKANTAAEAPAKSANTTEESKPAEVPESPDTNSSTNNHENAKVEKNEEEMEEEADHAVDGDEDTVIY